MRHFDTVQTRPSLCTDTGHERVNHRQRTERRCSEDGGSVAPATHHDLFEVKQCAVHNEREQLRWDTVASRVIGVECAYTCARLGTK